MTLTVVCVVDNHVQSAHGHRIHSNDHLSKFKQNIKKLSENR